jgi:hypothetical protein
MLRTEWTTGAATRDARDFCPPALALAIALLSLLFCSSLPGSWQPAEMEGEIRIASLEELARYAAESGHVIRMEPGVYRPHGERHRALAGAFRAGCRRV